MEEVWRDVFGYEGLYQVSNYGRVFSIRTGTILTPQLNKKTGYLGVMLVLNNKHFYKYVHRLVAEAFIPNPYGLKEVNHRDHNKQNCKTDNLEWCTRTTNSKDRLPWCKTYQYDMNGNLLNVFNSVKEAALYLFPNTKKAASRISSVCSGKSLSYRNFIFTHKIV